METTSAKSPFSSYRNTAIIIGVVVVVVFLIVRVVRAIQKANEYNNLANDPNAQIAFELHAAFNPWGDILGVNVIAVDGTDEEAAFALATKIKDLNAVRASYKRLYNEELLERVATEFQNDRPSLERWLALAGNPNTPITPIPNKSLVYAKQTVTMYDADDSRKVVKTYQSGDKIGTYEKELAITSKGVKYIYVQVIWDKGWFWDSKGLVRKDFVKFA